jgi:hypothetical protein
VSWTWRSCGIEESAQCGRAVLLKSGPGSVRSHEVPLNLSACSFTTISIAEAARDR